MPTDPRADSMYGENALEFLNGQNTMTFTFSSRKYINLVKRLHSRNPEAFEYFIQNKDGTVCGRLPLNYLKISPPRKVNMSDAQREILSNRLKSMHSKDTPE